MSARTTAHPPPRRAPAAAVVACLVAALLVAVAVVAAHDLAVARDWASGPTWASSLVDVLDGLEPSAGLALAGGAIGLVGAALVLLSLARGRRTHVPVTVDDPDAADLWLTPGAVAALAHEVVDRSAGVLSADVRKAGRRRVVIAASAHRDPEQALARAREALEAGVGSATPVRITVRATKDVQHHAATKDRNDEVTP